MRLKGRLKRIKPLTNCSDSFFKEIQTKGIATGNDAMTLDSIVFHNNGYYLPYDYYTEETTSCYVYYNRTIYNLIIMKTKAYFDKWVYATNMMSHYVKTIPDFIDRIKDKEKRVLLFEKYKERWEEENKC